MNKTKIIMRLMFFVFITSTTFANTWTFQDSGTVTDTTGKECIIFSDITISSEMQELISNTLDVLWAIPGLSGTKSSVMVDSDNYFFFTIYPESLVYQEIELNDFLPSGLSFRYEYSLFYDATLKVDDYLPRITGAYVSPTGLLDQLYEVTIMPELYVHGDVLLERIARLESAVMALSKKSVFSQPKSVSDDIVLEVVAAYKKNPNITVSEVVSQLKEDGMAVAKKDVEAVFMVYLGIIPE